MSAMVDRVAQAMAENAGFCWENCAQTQWKSDARAGITAMREPTFDPDLINYSCEMTRADFWRAMIDEALSKHAA